MTARAVLTPDDRALAISRSKAVAFRFVAAVKASDSAMVRMITDGLSWEELAGLAIVLAECADTTRLKVVKDATDDGLPALAQERAA